MLRDNKQQTFLSGREKCCQFIIQPELFFFFVFLFATFFKKGFIAGCLTIPETVASFMA